MNRRQLLVGVAVLTSLALTFAVLSPTTLYVDEYPHLRIMFRFVKGIFDIDETLPMWPGWHVVGMLLLRFTGIQDPGAALLFMRLITCAMTLVAVWAFYACARMVVPDDAELRTLQFAWCPILVPYEAIVFTDVPSLALFLVGLMLTLKRRYDGAGAVMAAAILVRQTNVLWLAFLVAFAWHQEHGLRFNTQGLRQHRVALAVMGMVAAVGVAHRGLVFNARALASNPPGLYVENLYMAGLFLGALFVMPLLAHTRRLGQALKRPTTLLALGVAGLVFYLKFKAGSQFNVPPGYTCNQLLGFFLASPPRKGLLFVLIALGGVGILTLPLAPPSAHLWIPFAAASLAPIWGISFRYCFVPFAVLLLFRSPERAPLERAMAALYAAASVIVMWCMVTGLSFPT